MTSTSNYREAPLPGPANPCVECTWTSKMSGPSNFTVTPDGCADLLLRRGDGGFALEIVGPMSRSQHVSLMGENNFLAIRFKPGMLGRALAIPSESLVDLTVPCAQVLNLPVALESKLQNCSDEISCLEWLSKVLRPLDRPTSLENAIELLVSRSNTPCWQEVWDMAGTGERQFRRLCQQWTGFSPKTLHRICRFRRVVEQLQAPNCPSLASLAAEIGYTDQSHLHRDFVEFGCMTPIQYRRQFLAVAHRSLNSNCDQHKA